MSGLPSDIIVSAFVTLFVVVEPIGLAPIFLSVTHELPDRARRQVALRACLIAFIVLGGAALVGDWLLRMLAITLPAFRIAGGLLLFSLASEMVLGVRIRRESRSAEEAVRHDVRDVAAFPLAVPLMAGPGAITATVLLAGQAAARPAFLAALIGVIAAVMATCLAVFLLAALAVQFVVDGVRAVLAG